jgi:hypothetical protein
MLNHFINNYFNNYYFNNYYCFQVFYFPFKVLGKTELLVDKYESMKSEETIIVTIFLNNFCNLFS